MVRWARETPGWRASPPCSSLAQRTGSLVFSVRTIRRSASQKEVVAKLWFRLVAGWLKSGIDFLGNVSVLYS